MIKNFEEIKEQLRELSEIVNSFTSEAVQLRIVELVFGENINSEKVVSEDEEEAIPVAATPSSRNSIKMKALQIGLKKSLWLLEVGLCLLLQS